MPTTNTDFASLKQMQGASRKFTKPDFFLWSSINLVQPASRRAWDWTDTVAPHVEHWQTDDNDELEAVLQKIETAGFAVMVI